jgi:hypothetical protein
VFPERVLTSTTLSATAPHTLELPTVPTGATSVTLQLTANPGAAASSVAVCAGGSASAECLADPALVLNAGEPASTTVTVPVSGTTGNQVTFAATGGARVFADLHGYTVKASATAPENSVYTPVEPFRAVEQIGLTPRATSAVTLPTVPAGATAVAVTLTSSVTSAASYVSVCPAGQQTGPCLRTSVLNPIAGRDRQSSAVVRLGGSDGKSLQVYNHAGTGKLSVDVQGFYVATSTATAGGVLQTQTGTALPMRVIRPDATSTLRLTGVPAGATAVALRLNGAGAWRSTSISACPGDVAAATCSETSALTASPDAVARNVTLVPLGGANRDTITLSNDRASVRVTPEVTGYVLASSAVSTPAPTPTPTPTTSSPAPAPAPTAAPAPAPGTTKPGKGNTGVPAGTVLTVHEGDITVTTPGTVLDSMDIRGFVTIKAANVTIRNSIIRGTAATSPRGLVSQAYEGGSVLIEDTEIYAAQPSGWIDGVRGWNITARRVNVHDVIDGFHLYGSNTTIESSWIHDHLHYANDPHQGGGASHDDSIQIQKGAKIRIVGNTIEDAYNTGIQFTQDQGVVSDVQILKNWADGGGCTVNLAEKGKGPFQGVVINDNTFGQNTRVDNCAIISPESTKVSAARNVFTNGSVATVRPGS